MDREADVEQLEIQFRLNGFDFKPYAVCLASQSDANAVFRLQEPFDPDFSPLRIWVSNAMGLPGSLDPPGRSHQFSDERRFPRAWVARNGAGLTMLYYDAFLSQDSSTLHGLSIPSSSALLTNQFGTRVARPWSSSI